MTDLNRRRFVAGTGTLIAAGTLAGCTGNGGDGDDVPEEIDEFLADAGEYDGSIVDATGDDEVVVDVGAGPDNIAFSPPAVRIDAGSTVRWEWTGEGGAHNVVSTDQSESDFESGNPVDGSEETFEQSFDDDGLQFYVCQPHEAQGMLGAIEVVDN